MTAGVDPALVRAYLDNVESALNNNQILHAESLLTHIQELMSPIFHQNYHSSGHTIALSAGVGLDPGIKRRTKPNEDYTFTARGTRMLSNGEAEPFGLFIVADGMGGHVRGSEASCLAAHTCVDYIFPRVEMCQGRGATLKEILVAGIQEANRAVFEYSQKHNDIDDKETTRTVMGTTITALLVVGPEAYIANVGDSRTYLYRGNQLIQITEDHSHVGQLVRDGAIRPHEIYTHPQRNIIYRCLGEQSVVKIDTFYWLLQNDDVLLLCSDGLWEMVPDQSKIAQILSSSSCSVRNRAERLIELALHGGGQDNVGLIVVHVNMHASALKTMIRS